MVVGFPITRNATRESVGTPVGGQENGQSKNFQRRNLRRNFFDLRRQARRRVCPGGWQCQPPGENPAGAVHCPRRGFQRRAGTCPRGHPGGLSQGHLRIEFEGSHQNSSRFTPQRITVVYKKRREFGHVPFFPD